MKYNHDFELKFEKKLQSMDLEILSERQYIEETVGLFDLSRETEVSEDVYNKHYYHIYKVHDNIIHYDYELSISHSPRKKLAVIGTTEDYYRDMAENYDTNYKLMENIIEEHGGLATKLSDFSGAYIDDYLLLIYLPDAVSMINTQSALYDQIYGGNAGDHIDVTNRINVDIPRFIFCSRQDTYEYMLENLKAAKEYIYGKNYECKNSHADENDILLEQVCILLLGDRSEQYRINKVNNANTLNGTVSRNYLTGIESEDWIALYELETGVDYYLTVFESLNLNH